MCVCLFVVVCVVPSGVDCSADGCLAPSSRGCTFALGQQGRIEASNRKRDAQTNKHEKHLNHNVFVSVCHEETDFLFKFEVKSGSCFKSLIRIRNMFTMNSFNYVA